MITKHVQPLLGHLAITAVNGEVLDHFYADLRRCRDHRAGHRCWALAPATVRKIHYLISGAYRRALRGRWLDHNPAADAEPPPKPRPEPQPSRGRNRSHYCGRGCADHGRRLGGP